MKSFIAEDSFWELFPQAAIGVVVVKGMKPAAQILQEDVDAIAALLDRANIDAERHLTSDTISENAPVKAWREAYRLFKTKKGAHLVSSCFILVRGDEKLAMGDCAINISYEDSVDKEGNVTLSAAQKLAEVAVESARTAEFFGIDPKVALLSFSTKGSGKGGTVQLSHDATIEAQKLAPEMAIDGEMQFDAAVSPVVGQLKFPGSKVAGYANTFIFPCIEAGNIGYKIAQRLGGFEAYGPILQGLNAPINDLSRGCNADEVYKMAIITAGMA